MKRNITRSFQTDETVVRLLKCYLVPASPIPIAVVKYFAWQNNNKENIGATGETEKTYFYFFPF